MAKYTKIFYKMWSEFRLFRSRSIGRNTFNSPNNRRCEMSKTQRSLLVLSRTIKDYLITPCQFCLMGQRTCVDYITVHFAPLAKILPGYCSTSFCIFGKMTYFCSNNSLTLDWGPYKIGTGLTALLLRLLICSPQRKLADWPSGNV